MIRIFRQYLKPTSSILARRAFADSFSHKPGPLTGKAGEVANDSDQATGLEREELIAKAEGRDLFLLGEKRNYYGTRSRPAYILSHFTSRIVGCSGYPLESHETRWFEVAKDEPRRCDECGQFFELKQLPTPENHHHGHGH